MKRRSFLLTAAPLLAAKESTVKLSIGTYGMQTLEVDRALAEIQSIGYDGAELCLMSGWPSEPSRLDSAARRRIRQLPFPICSLLENFSLTVPESTHQKTLDRIRTAATLAHDISPKIPPMLQSVLGGKPDEWEAIKHTMARRLADWAKTAQANQLQLVVKSHIGSASDTPEKLIWLLDQVNNPALSAIYDYSHFQLLNVDLEASLNTLLPRSTLVTVKDGRLVDGKPQFLLPGQGTINYRKYFRILKSKSYRGWMLVEISRQLQNQAGYNPLRSARISYRYLSPLLESAGLR